MKRSFILPIRAVTVPVILTTSLPPGQTGVAYSQTLTAANGQLPYRWSYTGTLDPGLSLNAITGVISGTPTTANLYSIVVTVTDSNGRYFSQGLQLTITSLPVVATPTFSPAAGSYSSAQTVTISDATTGATIYYTTNGTTPTTSSTVYSAPITVSTTQTVQAIAAKSGYANSAIGSASYAINSGSYVLPIAMNIAAGGTGDRYPEGGRIFKNAMREGQGYQSIANGGPAQLNSSGWPIEDVQCNLMFLLSTGVYPPWVQGNWSCGFIGQGTPAAYGDATISNIVYGNGTTTYTTFTLVPTYPFNSSGYNGFGFTITGSTASGGTINHFAYLPAFNTLNTIDFLPSATSVPASAYIPAAVSFYQQVPFIRLMTMYNSLDDGRVATSSNRLTIANCQAPMKSWSGSTAGSFTSASYATLIAGATNAVLTSWQMGVGTFFLQIPCSSAGGGYSGILVTISSTATSNVPCTFAALTSNVPTGNSWKCGSNAFPLAWMIGLANACGSTGLWINLPFLEDGTQYSAGSHTTAVCNELKNTYTSSGVLRFELGNEIWQGDLCTFMGQYVSYLDGYQSFSSSGISWDYLAYRLVQQANAISAVLSGFGTTVRNVSAFITDGEGQNAAAYILGKINTTYGTALNYVHEWAIAPYGNPTINTGDSVATIYTEIGNAFSAAFYGAFAETIAANALRFGVPLVAYESNPVQWNDYSGITNAGAAIQGSGYQTLVTEYYQMGLSSAFQVMAHFTDGYYCQGGVMAPVDELTIATNYPNVNSTPAMAGILAFATSFTPNRNVVSGSGSIVNTASYGLDNVACSLNVNSYGKGGLNYGVSRYTGVIVNCTSPGTYNAVVTWSGTSGGTAEILYAAPGYAMVAASAGQVSLSNSPIAMGQVTLRQGTNLIGWFGTTSSGTPTQVQFN